MHCGVPESVASQTPICVPSMGGVEFGDHVFMKDLFRPKDPPPPTNLVEMSMDERPVGLGLYGERFDLTCPDCEKTFLRLKKSVHGYFYGCPSWPDCSGTHGAHPDGRPKGIPGNKATRVARIAAHEVFDQLFKGPKPYMGEAAAYLWMATEMKISAEEAHIARFSIAQCEQLIRLANVALGPSAWNHLEEDPFGSEALVIAESETTPVPPTDVASVLERLENEPDGEMFTIAAFQNACRRGDFNDDDGIGYFGTRTWESRDVALCSEMAHAMALLPRHLMGPDPRYTHVWWYNK